MKKDKLEKIKICLLGVIVCLLIVILFVVSTNRKVDMDNKNKVDVSDKNSENYDQNQEDDLENKTEKPSDVINDKNQIVEDNSNKKEESNTTNNDIVENNKQPEKEEIHDESAVITYFEDIDQKIDTYKGTNDETLKEKIKDKFIIMVDFIFYDGTIKGYKFDELTEEAKIKVLTFALKIDNKIDEYFPNYKESIKSKMGDFKERIVLLYLETTATLCEKVGSIACEEARNNFKTMKESFGFTWDKIKKVASSSYSSLSKLLKEWYQSIK